MTYGIAQRGADGKAERQPAPAHAKYWSAAAGATLPLYFDRGRHIRQLSLSAGWEYSNGMVADVDAIRYDAEGRIANLQTLGYREGLHKLSLGIGFSDVVRAAYRDVGTPWGYTLWAGYDLNPENRNFSDLVSAYARIYTPDLHPRVLPPQLPLRSGSLPNFRRRLPLPVGAAIPRLQIDPAVAQGLLLVRHFEQ